MDACRADLFEKVADLNEFDGYDRITSIESKTRQWAQQNFKGEEYGDTVYITANPVVSQEVPNNFHDLIEVWSDQDAYNEEVYTIPPEPVIKYTRDAVQKYPNKRFIIHFVQPHYPFITRPGLIYRKNWKTAEEVGVQCFIEENKENNEPDNVWEALEDGLVSKSDVYNAYRENLEYVLDDVINLANEIPGKSVISSDHGNMIGEGTVLRRKIYGHPAGYRSPELMVVPWAELDSESRKELVNDGVHSESLDESDVINQRLSALGYKT